ncbi:MAG: DUF1573 domain-containing protein [Bacteroidales bacterium]|nr:DUF1573 domain-containing protein [Bacteroidales bacterium]
MKKVTLFTIICLFTISLTVTAQQEQATVTHVKKSDKNEKTDGPVAEFDKLIYDFGDIKQGTPKTAEFTLTNKGKEPLIISYARASCGCTNLNYSKEPILPEKSIPISVTYNAAAPGKFIKSITVRTNAGARPVTLRINGTVIKKPVPIPPQKK